MHVSELAVNARAAVGATTCLMSDCHKYAESTVLDGTRRFSSTLVRVEAAARHSQLPAHPSHGPGRLLRRDEREFHAFSFAKKAAHFFSSSRSILRSTFSLRSRASSARSSPVKTAAGAPFDRWSFARLTHSNSTDSDRPTARATSMTDLPPSSTSPTAPSLNSSECFRRGFFFGADSMVSILVSSRRMSTESDQAQRRAPRPSRASSESRRPQTIRAAAYASAEALSVPRRTCVAPRLRTNALDCPKYGRSVRRVLFC